MAPRNPWPFRTTEFLVGSVIVGLMTGLFFGFTLWTVEFLSKGLAWFPGIPICPPAFLAWTLSGHSFIYSFNKLILTPTLEPDTGLSHGIEEEELDTAIRVRRPLGQM